ncbi:ArgE/DapE family deacylase [Companilactobacillus halodurans]|uniref:Probable succinyl-diaminopimelate desuccinylase n=1 Tax=Companilactobacillus halodurans TaxID=2584183 RepID=A0A5P0ZLY9_9LACO|nr:ArgE/DapE family deacylase [Companilactobacillus halodurans]MQS75196.1 ArgE/DapE family deacylase [Companilactobacillus halodurans]MQS98498.1 ArgE/DapE family deacylase [Companilactobacillus halodurans]
MKREEKLEILSNLIAIDTVNDNEAKVADYISSLFAPYKNKGVSIDRVSYSPGRDNLVVTIGDSKKTLGFTGHEDVVSTGDLDSWDSDPFKAEIRNNKIYGRGASDMKSGLAAIIITMLEMLENDAVPGRIKLLATVGEETGEYGAAQLTKKGYADDLSGLIIAEPTEEMQNLIYTGKGVIDYVVTSVGKGAHSSTPEKGINAIDHLIDFADEVRKLMATFDKVDPVLGKLTHVQSVFQGGEQTNSVPDKAIIKGNIRSIPAYNNQMIFDAINDLIARLNKKPGYDLKIEYVYPEEAVPGNPNSDFVKLLKNSYQTVYSKELSVAGQAGASDASEFLHAKNDFDIVIVGPGNDTMHQSNENCDVDVFLKSVDFYKQAAFDFFK